MFKTTRNNAIIERIKDAAALFAAYSITFIIILLVVRVFEIVYTGHLHNYPKSVLKLSYFALLSDVIFWLRASAFLAIIYVPLSLVNSRIANTFYTIAAALICIIYIGLIQYFNQAMVPLGADMWGYKWADIKQTVGAGGGVKLSFVFIIILALAVLIFLMDKLPKRLKLANSFSISLVAVSLLFLFFIPSNIIHAQGFETDFINNEAINKTDYFFTQSYNHFFPQQAEIDIYADSYAGDFAATENTSSSFTYIDEENYPFLHSDSTADVLSPFFNKSTTPPNIVILMVEGLGRAFTNQGAYLGNFTPFIDSLSNNSLYWPNFLSEGGRTFAVLPSLLGSLPFAKNGFNELGDKMPPHLSLLSLLKKNGYKTSFFYGGDAKFDNMELFLRKNKLDNLNDERTFPTAYTKQPSQNGFTWGYGDKELFRRYFEVAKDEIPTPSLNVILTVSTHNPFLINEEDQYSKRFEEHLKKIGLEEARLQEYRNYQKQYSSILYTDDAVKQFFTAYKTRKDFANTIFIITGDHRMPEIPMSNKIDRYHVPLIIYSPLLKRTATFQSISTHFDITPSLLAFLKTDYNIKLPALVSWMGTGLDTSRSFRNVHSYPFMQTKNDLVDFVSGDMQLNGESVLRLGQGMTSSNVDDQDKYNQLKSSFERFTRKNNKIANGALFIPDSIYQNYYPH